jgi:CubicO group peptidase (beta-lactamase class C family)
MSLKYKITLIIVGLVAGMLGKYLTGPSMQTFGTDFTPPLPVAASLRVSSYFSEDKTFANIDRQVGRFLSRHNMAGASVAIARDGKMVFAKGYGVADIENEMAVKPFHLFRVASISKLITAVGIMKLVEEGKLGLNDKVFGPEGVLNFAPFDDYLDKRAERIEIVHLLNHSAGWTSRWGDPMFMPQVVAQGLGKELPVGEDDIITFMLGKRLHFQPGTMSSYSNLGYVILGRVIESISGQDYESYIRTNLLYPLGIFDMRLGGSFPEERAELEVRYHEPSNREMVDDFMGNKQKVPRSYGGNDIRTLGAAGGWIASATDLLRFMLAIDGLPFPSDILSKESIELMTNNVSPGFQPLGWRSATENRWFRTGTLSGTSTLMVRRSDGVSYVILFNSSSWKGPMLSTDINLMMDNAIAQTNSWPNQDLFELNIQASK